MFSMLHQNNVARFNPLIIVTKIKVMGSAQYCVIVCVCRGGPGGGVGGLIQNCIPLPNSELFLHGLKLVNRINLFQQLKSGAIIII